MDKKDSYIELVKQAQLGDEKCMNRLAKLARERLRVYVHRLVLTDDLTQDILQESILEMFRSIGKLERADRFWPWLFRIAGNKVNRHYKQEQRRRTVSLSEIGYKGEHNDRQEDVADMISRELKQNVITAMYKLKPQQQNVLFLRCYEGLKYSEIAEAIGCSEIGAQMRFLRAKKALSKQLSRCGLGKGSLLMALVLFGKMTAPSKAAVAQITVTAAATKVGIAASVAAIAASKTAIISLTTAGALTVGTMVATSGTESGGVPREKPAESSSSYVMPQKVQAGKDSREYWYYYPSKAGSTIMMRVKGSDTKGKHQYCQYLQNAKGNYYFDRSKNTVHINNYRQWQKDLSVWRLPTDSFELTEFLAQIDGRKGWTGGVYRSQSGLLLVAKQSGQENSDKIQVTRHYNVLGEDYFKYDWPANVKMVDNRDVMHKRGWTYFKITGQINGKEVRGRGRIPFVYAASYRHWPWVVLKVADGIVNEAGFAGLSRPWMGLHTIDTVRRDAAQKYIWFETKYNKRTGKAQVVLKPEDRQIVYTIDMEKDVIEQITFSTSDGREGELRFSYMQEIDDIGSEFAEPRRRSSGGPHQSQPGMLWLVKLVNSF